MKRIMRIIRLWWYHFWKYGKWEHPIFKEYIYWLDRLTAWWKARELRKAKKMAVARHRTDGRTYYVIPDSKNRPRAFNNKEIAILKAHKLMHKNVTCLDLYREAMFIANAQTTKDLK